ncbi:hypothetical protein LX16_2981 [Stackebrandtia albiflava]|uniref:Uncharacterized protein n=1 Tax=Stackebrandtia albiflava TaxID=406432 RepID=A0A562V2V4_9ACTN|nr:hypothetical protein [Stackebrandtia albiflava]TWJ12226.1 hypothetical protein LX16_2981 [Stackebrandtia albiflava]
MNQFEGLTAEQLIAIAAPDHANLKPMRTQAMAARRYAIELDEAITLLAGLADQATTRLSGRFAESFTTTLTDLSAALAEHRQTVKNHSYAVDAIADEAEAVYTDLKRYEADRERHRQEHAALSPTEAALVDEMENELARQRMQDASDFYLERVELLEPQDTGPALQSTAAPAAPAPAPAAATPTPPGGGTAPGPVLPPSPTTGAPTANQPATTSPRPMTPSPPRPTPGLTGPRPPLGAPAPARTVPPVVGRRSTAPSSKPAAIRAVRAIPPPVIGRRPTPAPERRPDWRPTTRGPRGYTESVLGRSRGGGLTTTPFSRTPVPRTGDGLNRPVIGATRAAPEPRTAAPSSPEPRTDDMWAVGTTTVAAVIGGRNTTGPALHHPGPVALTGGSGRELPTAARRPAPAAPAGGLLDRIRRVQVRTVTRDRRVAARLGGTGDLTFDLGRVGTDMGALARAVRAAMVAALRGRDVATARIVGEPVEAAPGRADPLDSVEVEARSRLGYVRIRWHGRDDVTVDIDPRARGRLTDDQLASEVNDAAASVLRRHREHLADVNRRLAAAHTTDGTGATT